MTKEKEVDKLVWNEVEGMMQDLAEKIRQSGIKFMSVIGIPRGGLVIAVRLSHLLNLDLITNSEYITPHTLMVDDIADSGKTMKKYKNMFPMCATATLFYNPESCFEPDFWVGKQDYASWITFPWEVKK